MTDALDHLKAALSDRYIIERELGSGGMATVYLAEDLKLHRKVALEVLRPELAPALGPDRFLQEIDIAAKLNHPHVLALCDSGEADGFLYYVMPHVEGESLRDKTGGACMKLSALLVVAFVGWTQADAGSAQPDPCDDFYAALLAVPHDTLARSTGEIDWMWGGETHQGCEVRFVAHDSLAGPPIPDFDALEGSEMYDLGWRMSYGIGADGPGSGIFGIERDAVRCLVRWEQTAWIDDDGEFQQSDTFTMTIQCREVPSDP